MHAGRARLSSRTSRPGAQQLRHRGDPLGRSRRTPAVHRIADIAPDGLPISLRIVLENLLRHEDGVRVTGEQVQSLLAWGRAAGPTPLT